MIGSRSQLKGCLVALGVTTIALVNGQDLRLQVGPVFEGMEPSDGPYPVRVELSNKGPDARGVLKVVSSWYEMNYPVELPTGARKELVAYPFDVAMDGEAVFTLTTNQGRIEHRMTSDRWSYVRPIQVALISDAAGELAFTRKEQDTDTYDRPTAVKDVYVQPQDAPDRPVGYASLVGVVLGEGSERLNDAQVAAIQTWALAGGRIVFVGGAVSPLLRDPRWASYLPVENAKPRTVPGSAFAGNGGGLKAAVPVLIGEPAPGAYDRFNGGKGAGDLPLVLTKPVGLGRAIYWSFDPFRPPMNRWEGRRELFLTTVEPLDQGASGYIGQFVGGYQRGPDWYPTPAGPSPASARAPAAPYALPTAEDPFSVRPLPANRVFWVLAAFFVAVVPLNFLILRKLKRGELAWVTSPILSVGFGIYFMASAGDLYAAKLSRATRGVVIGTEGSSVGYFLGRSEIFFPKGGNYDLGFSRVDQIRSGDDLGDDYYYYRSHQNRQNPLMRDLGAIDLGEIRAPRMSTGNLTFREFTFRQRVDLGEGFRLDGEITGAGPGSRLRGRLTNASPYTLTDAALRWGSLTAPIKGSIPPGKSVGVDVKGDPAGARPVLGLGIKLEGYLEGPLEVGPKIGDLVAGRSRTSLIYSLAVREVAR